MVEFLDRRNLALLGLDIGTTSTKAVLFDGMGNELASVVSPPFQLLSPKPGWIEQDPELLWQSVLGVLRKIASWTGNIHLVAICITAQSGSLLPLDEEGTPTYPLITWMDGRTTELVELWKQQGIHSKVRNLNGWSLYPGLCLPSVAWIRDNDSETFAKTKFFFTVNDFIVYRLTGKRVNNPSNASGMLFVDIRTGDWSQELCEIAGISPMQLTPILPSGSVIGEIKDEICQMTGLARGVVLVNGGHDQVCTAFGLGINDPGKVLVACGTAWVITGVINSLQMTRMPETLDLNFHILPHRWTQSQSLGGLGAPLEWWLNETISLDRATQFSVLEQELARTQPNQQLFFMPLTGGFDNPATSSAGGFVGLQLSHTRAQMARAIMESAAFELKWSLLHWFKDGMQMDHLFLVGGAAQSSDWLKILAEVCGITIYIPQYDHWPSLGAAYLAGCGLGLFDLEQVPPDNFLKPYHQVIGDERQSALYETKFAAYRECRVDFNRLMRKIATRV